jgi:hypothetical protein
MDQGIRVNGLNEIFGHRLVFYELGNESDLSGFDKVAPARTPRPVRFMSML